MRDCSLMDSPDQKVAPRLVLVDGHAYAYRSFHAIKNLASPSGFPTNAIYGFIKTMGRLRTILKPTHWAVIWDGGLAVERLAALPDYKAQRPDMPDSLSRQIPCLISWLEAARISSLQQEGIEADDWIATLACRARSEGTPVVIASSDKDFMQLVGEGIGLFNPNDKTPVIWAEAEVRAKTGVAPQQIVDWLSLVGDSVDNIPGVPGVGPKNATKLLQQFGSVDALYERLEEVASASIQAHLRGAQDLVKRNQQLIALNRSLAVNVAINDLIIKSPNSEKLRCLYEEWGLRSLARELDNPERQGDLFEPMASARGQGG